MILELSKFRYFRAAREFLEDEKSAVWREFRETASLLKDTAERHMHAERVKGGDIAPLFVTSIIGLIGNTGLVIGEAIYGLTEPDEEAQSLLVDVTTAVQALVHNSQVYIPGHRSKVSSKLYDIYSSVLYALADSGIFIYLFMTAVCHTRVLRPRTFSRQDSPHTVPLPWPSTLCRNSRFCACCASVSWYETPPDSINLTPLNFYTL